MKIHRLLEKTRAEGVGVRFCIWVQGCRRHCKGCFAVDTWDPEGGFEISADEIIGKISAALGEIEGITLLGGEPFEQAGELSKIAEFAHNKGLSVIAFTGGRYESLCDEYAGAAELLKWVDVLIDGEFELKSRSFDRPLVGSRNQRFIFLTDRISEAEMMACKNRFEVRLLPDGRTEVNGMGDYEELRRRLNMI